MKTEGVVMGARSGAVRTIDDDCDEDGVRFEAAIVKGRLCKECIFVFSFKGQ